MKNKFKFYKQQDQRDCGPTCIRMIAHLYGREIPIQIIRELCGIGKEGVSLLDVKKAANKLGFDTYALRQNLFELKNSTLPLILHWSQNHFVVLTAINGEKYTVADPSEGTIVYSKNEFREQWIQGKESENEFGISLSMTPNLFIKANKYESIKPVTFTYLLKHLLRYKKLLIQLFLGLLLGSIIQMIFPYLTQTIVDSGINDKNISLIYIILIAQTMLLFGRTTIEFIRSWILLIISTKLNISILSEFIAKLMRLPMNFFDSKLTGDLMQRMSDQQRIESFLTGPSLNIAFSLINLLLYSLLIINYDISIFGVFLISNLIYSFWVFAFLSKRRKLEMLRFKAKTENQNVTIQLLSGMQEIKLNGCEQQKRIDWEGTQVTLSEYNSKSLALEQRQKAGALFINEGKNILITGLVATAVVNGNITLGSMMAIQYIIGQINSPIEQFLSYIQQLQDAKISLERLNEVQTLDEEEPPHLTFKHELPIDQSITFKRVSFRYSGSNKTEALKNISLKIEQGKTTAIVGRSGSGKTTLVKLLLRYYKVNSGKILVGQNPVSEISFKYWRRKCGVVMQEGYIFSSTILENIVIDQKNVDYKKLNKALSISNLNDFIENLPLKLQTKIGSDGVGISQGQRQRILIARAVYKDPTYLFFDEATNALDSINETQIMKNLSNFYNKRTVVIVAHRLSTVRNADNIIVLDKGEILEQGSHEELIKRNGRYLELIKNQLELN